MFNVTLTLFDAEAQTRRETALSLQTGAHLGAYEILSLLGAGGMREVYRARDSKLDRDVAIKVLPEAFARDKRMMAVSVW